tara:strand:- start:1181 stop:1330 length:150 start_codon:yes stop_codon:yes gene_type:complete
MYEPTTYTGDIVNLNVVYLRQDGLVGLVRVEAVRSVIILAYNMNQAFKT